MDTPTGPEIHSLVLQLQSLAHTTARLLVQSPVYVANATAREVDQILDPLLTQLARVRRDRVALAVDAARRAQRCWHIDTMTPSTVKIAASRLLISSSALTLSDAAARRILHSTGRTGTEDHGTGVVAEATRTTEPVPERLVARDTRQYEPTLVMVDMVQRELLPRGLPVLPRVHIAANYLLADSDTAAGGDWFDAFGLPGGRVALVVGDVVGHGVAASVTMGQLRILLHERLTVTGDLAAALRTVDAAAERIQGARAATVCVVVLDPVTGALEYCTAGHSAPLVVSTSGGARYLSATGAGPLGVGGQFTPASVGTESVAVGELVLLYTDGVLERPGRELAQSTVELALVVADITARRGPTEHLCTRTLELLTRDTGHSDDIVLLAAQLVAPPPDLVIELAATTESLVPLLERLQTWLALARIGGRDADVLRHATVELATNAIEHAYIDIDAARHSFTLTATLTESGEVRLQVTD